MYSENAGRAGQAVNEAVSVGTLQGTLRRMEELIDSLAHTVNRVEGAANFIDPQPAELKSAKADGTPRQGLSLSRLENDLASQINRLQGLLSILS